MADVQRTSWIAIRSGCVKLPHYSHVLTYTQARTCTSSFFLTFSRLFRRHAQPSPYLQQRFYFVSEHGLNRQRVRNKRFARSSLPERMLCAPSESAACGELRTICLQVVSPREAYTRYTGYKVSNAQDDGGATKGRERKRDDLEESSIRLYRTPSNGDKRVSSRRYKAFRILIFVYRFQHHV